MSAREVVLALLYDPKVGVYDYAAPPLADRILVALAADPGVVERAARALADMAQHGDDWTTWAREARAALAAALTREADGDRP